MQYLQQILHLSCQVHKAVVNWLNALDQSDFSWWVWCIIVPVISSAFLQEQFGCIYVRNVINLRLLVSRLCINKRAILGKGRRLKDNVVQKDSNGIAKLALHVIWICFWRSVPYFRLNSCYSGINRLTKWWQSRPTDCSRACYSHPHSNRYEWNHVFALSYYYSREIGTLSKSWFWGFHPRFLWRCST